MVLCEFSDDLFLYFQKWLTVAASFASAISSPGENAHTDVRELPRLFYLQVPAQHKTSHKLHDEPSDVITTRRR